MQKGLILHVDSSSLRKKQIDELFTPEGFSISVAENGLEALNLAAGKQYDLIIIENELPDMEGVSVARTISGFKQKKNPPFILLSNTTTGLKEKINNEFPLIDTLAKKPIDLAKLKALVLELFGSQDESKSSSLISAEGIAGLAKELKRPLTAIMGYADALQDPKLRRETLLNGLQNIAHNGSSLLQIIDDLLAISAIEQNTFSVVSRECSPLTLIEELEEQTEDSCTTFKVRYQGKLPETISTDPHYLIRMLRGLMESLQKVTQQNEFTLDVSYDLKPNRMKFSVSDTSMSVSSQDIRRLQRIVASPLSKGISFTESNCLGLIFISHAAKYLGGKLEIHDKTQGKNSFSLSIDAGDAARKGHTRSPNNREASERTVSVEPEQISGKVLIAEDNFETQRVFTFMLKNTNARFVFADNGAIAVEKALAEPFDIVLMDLMMPVMGGVAATRKLREAGCTTPIIAVTAAASASSKHDCFEAGCNDYLEKPVSLKRLYRTLAEYLPLSTSRIECKNSEEDKSAKHENHQPSNPLGDSDGEETNVQTGQIEVDPLVQEIIDEFLQNLPKRFADISGGITEGNWKRVRTIANELAGTASMCGFSEAANTLLKIEVVGGSEDPEEVESLLEQVKQQMAALTKNEATAATENSLTAEQRISEAEGKVIHSEFLDTCEELVPIILDFLDSVDDRVADLENLVQARKWDELRTSSHEVAGTAALCGFSDFSGYAKKLETTALQSDEMLAEDLLNELREVTSAMIRGKKNLKGS